MNWSTDQNPSFGPKTTGQAEHFCPVGLHVEIADGIDLWPFLEAMGPAENRLLFVVEQVTVDPIIRPAPKAAINLMMMPEKFPTDDIGLVDLFGKRSIFLPVLCRQHTNLKLISL